MLYRVLDIQRRILACPWNLQGYAWLTRSVSLKWTTDPAICLPRTVLVFLHSQWASEYRVR